MSVKKLNIVTMVVNNSVFAELVGGKIRSLQGRVRCATSTQRSRAK